MGISIAHVCIKTKDLEKTIQFYTDILGMTKVFNFTKNGRPMGCYLKVTKGQYVEVFEEEDAPDGQSAIAHLCLQADDIDGMIAKLNAAGVETTPKKLGCDNTYQTWFKDPNGIDIEFHQYTEKSTQLLGGDVEIDW